ncbi:MAG: hypothetical protein IIT79_01195 [Aeriscardovia sp.]|nr:hypothetical protein [Aeriscardovia sp.]
MDRHSPPSGNNSPSGGKKLRVVRFALASAFCLAAIAFFILSILSSALWKPKSEISASLSSSSKYMASVPGLLSLTGSEVSVKASSGQPVCVAIGQSGDVEGWIGSSPYTQISGLSSWTALASSPATGSQSWPDIPSVPFQDSDMWEKAECGRAMGFQWDPSADQSLILFNPAGASVDLSLGWKRVKVVNLTGPYAFLGCVCALMAWVALEFERLRKKGRAKAEKAEGGEGKEEGGRPRWAEDQAAEDQRRGHARPRTVRSTKVFRIREKSEEDEVSTQVMDLSALRHMDFGGSQDPMAQKPSLFGSEPPSFPATFSALAAGTAFSVESSKESDPRSKNKGPAIIDKRSVNLLAKSGSSEPVQLHPESGDLSAYFKRLREEKREEERKHEKKG